MKMGGCDLCDLGALGTIIKVETPCSLPSLNLYPQSWGNETPAGSPCRISASLGYLFILYWLMVRVAIATTSDESVWTWLPYSSDHSFWAMCSHTLLLRCGVFHGPPACQRVCVHLSPSPNSRCPEVPQVLCGTWKPWACNLRLFFLLFNLGFIFNFIGVQLIYNVVSISGVQHSDSAVCIHISTLFKILFSYRLSQNIE